MTLSSIKFITVTTLFALLTILPNLVAPLPSPIDSTSTPMTKDDHQLYKRCFFPRFLSFGCAMPCFFSCQPAMMPM
ncbi:16139_t:CDS:1, partial [Cetraspora pellucida]